MIKRQMMSKRGSLPPKEEDLTCMQNTNQKHTKYVSQTTGFISMFLLNAGIYNGCINKECNI